MSETYIVVINMTHRKDRLSLFYETMAAVGLQQEKIMRFEAICMPQQGWVGCVRSHIAVIEMAKNLNWPYVIVFEDDFMWKPEGVEWAKQLIGNPRDCLSGIGLQEWDVLMLGVRIIQKKPLNVKSLTQVTEGATSSGYIVRQHYYDTLLENLKQSEKALLPITRYTDYAGKFCMFALDRYWKSLQQKDKWITFTHPLGKQADGFSDICQVNRKNTC